MAERLNLRFDDDGVATITLTHPPLGIYDLAMRDELIEAVTAVRDVPTANCLLVRTSGQHFGAGADLSEFGTADSVLEARRIRWQVDPWNPLLELPIPTLAALRGFALGSGLELALLCDLRIAEPGAVLGLPETKLGMLPAAGGTQSLTRAVGPHATLPWVLTGDRLTAADALRIGVVTEVVDDSQLDQRATELATELARTPRPRWQAVRACLTAANDLPLAAGLEVEARHAAVLAPT